MTTTKSLSRPGRHEVYDGHKRMPKPTPRMLDWALNGVPVYIRKRPIDGQFYATMTDFSRFIKEAPEAEVRVRITVDTPKDFDPCGAPEVLAKLYELRNGTRS